MTPPDALLDALLPTERIVALATRADPLRQRMEAAADELRRVAPILRDVAAFGLDVNALIDEYPFDIYGDTAEDFCDHIADGSGWSPLLNGLEALGLDDGLDVGVPNAELAAELAATKAALADLTRATAAATDGALISAERILLAIERRFGVDDG